jgi:hypothetical protein
MRSMRSMRGGFISRSRGPLQKVCIEVKRAVHKLSEKNKAVQLYYPIHPVVCRGLRRSDRLRVSTGPGTPERARNLGTCKNEGDSCRDGPPLGRDSETFLSTLLPVESALPMIISAKIYFS